MIMPATRGFVTERVVRLQGATRHPYPAAAQMDEDLVNNLPLEAQVYPDTRGELTFQ